MLFQYQYTVMIWTIKLISAAEVLALQIYYYMFDTLVVPQVRVPCLKMLTFLLGALIQDITVILFYLLLLKKSNKNAH